MPVRSSTRWRSLTMAIRLLVVGALLLAGAGPAAARATRSYPNVPLINQDGEVLHFYDDVIKGKVVAINLIFTNCGGSCPLETAKLKQVQRLLGDHAGKEVFMYSITVDPDRDTPPVLKEYMKKYDVGPGWQFLTGRKEDIDQVRKSLGMLNTGEQNLSDHNINFILGNEERGIWLKRTPFDVPESTVAVLLGHRLQKRSLLINKPSYAATQRLPAAHPGADVYTSRCVSCHSIGGGNDLGPDLRGVTDSRDPKWLFRFVKEPDAVLAENDPLARLLLAKYDDVPMPNLQLTDKEVRSVIDYLRIESHRISAQARQ